MFGPGQVLQNRYTIARSIASGGQAVVYLATDANMFGQQVVVKAFNLNAIPPADWPAAMRLFASSAMTFAPLSHPNLARIYDYFTEKAGQLDVPCLVMEYVAGQTLEAAVRNSPSGFDEATVAGWGRQLCDVLTYLHSHAPPIIFRDLKPENVILTPQGQLKLIDFGIARTFKFGQTTDTERFGTLGYSPPEQLGRGQTGPYSDVYALGVTLLRMATGLDPGAAPMQFPRADQIKPTLSTHFANVISQATQVQIADRYRSAAEVRQALDSGVLHVALPGALAAAHPATLVSHVSQTDPPKRPVWLAWLVGAVVVLACLAAGSMAILLASSDPGSTAGTGSTGAAGSASPTRSSSSPVADVTGMPPIVVVVTATPTSPQGVESEEAPTSTLPPTSVPRPTATRIAIAEATACADTSPYRLSPGQMRRLGCPAQGFVRGRIVVSQRFERGFMIVFDDGTNSDFTRPNQRRRFFAIADDGRAWRVFFENEQVPQTTSTNPDDWYACERRAGQRPEQSGIPWRGFGLVWCNYPDIRAALGRVQPGGAEVKGLADFQSYLRGRAFGFGGRTYVVYLNSVQSEEAYITGEWE